MPAHQLSAQAFRRLLLTRWRKMNKSRSKGSQAKSIKQGEKSAKATRSSGKNPSTKSTDESQQSSKISHGLQQKCLNIFRDALWTGPEDIATLQEVKGHLYNRDFARAFGSEPYLRAYALRWSAARALGYMQVFEDVDRFIAEQSRDAPSGEPSRVLAIGGGAGAELVSIAGWQHLVEDVERDETRSRPVEASLVDLAAWQPISAKLGDAVVSLPPVSKYASAAVREANTPLVSKDRFNAICEQADVLEWSETTVSERMRTTDLVTIMFTLNELYSTSVPKTQRLLKYLTTSMRSSALLLVVDSPGSYSTVSLNGAEKKYPMQWLLDHTLLGSRPEDAVWEKVLTNESKWFRLPDGLDYPVDLENMRYQIHLYRRRSSEFV